jgi:PKD repeat protein
VDNGSGYVLIPGATNSTLLLTNLQTTNSGNYALFATNAAGVLNSTPLTLNVQTLPSPLAINVQFDGTTYTGSHATPQVGGAVVGGGSDYWNPVSNPKPLVGDTNPISGSLVLLDVNNYGTPMSLTYTGASQDYNNGNNTPFNGSGSPAENLMQASLVTLNSNTASVTMHGIPAGVYDLYLYSSDSSSLQQDVTRFSANDSYDTSGPNDMNNVLTLEANYVHLTPTVTANGLLTISFAGIANGRGNLNGLQLSGPGATVLPPVACFTATPANVFATQLVAFTDTSSGNITNWVWNFGDGSSVTNVSGSTTHAYAAAGAYTVSLTANGPGGANTTNGVAAVTVYGQPTLGSAVLSAGSMTFSGTGGIPGAQYRILTSTDVALPLASWTPVATGTFASDGSYSYTQSFLTNAASFFLLVTP